MGAEQSSSNRNERANQQYSKEEVNRMLEQQRKLFEKMSQNSNAAYAQQTAREEARREVERLMKEKKEELNRQNVQSSNPSSRILPPRAPPPTTVHLDRNKAPYSFTGQELKNHLTTIPSTSNVNLYPKFCNEASVSSDGLDATRYFTPTTPPAPRDRSIPRNRNRASSAARNGNDDEGLTCSTCKNSYTMKIFQCQRGHSSCVHCKNRLANCGICRLPITNMRNITLEAYIGERKINCQNSDDGCSLQVKLVDMDNHLKECPFREMNCPLAAIFGQCQWRGKLPQMCRHFDEVHQMHRQGNVDTEMRLLNVTHDSQIAYYVVMGNFNFLFHTKVSEQDGMMYMTVQLLGTQHSASKWSYGIYIYNKAEPRRKYEYSDTCNTINTPINTIFADSKCAVIPLSYVNTFVNNDCVTYKFFIKKEVDGRNNNFAGNNYRRRDARRRN